MSRQRMLILSYTPTEREPRVLKQIAQFRDEFDVTTAGFGSRSADGVRHVELDPTPPRHGIERIRGLFMLLLLVRAYALYERLDPLRRDGHRRLQGGQWDVVITHDVRTVALAESLASSSRILVDLHEYAPGDAEPSLAWRLFSRPLYRWILRRRVARAGGVTTVSSGIADRYRREFGFDATVVVNATPFHPLVPGPVGETIRLVHSGVPAPERRLEILVEAVRRTTTPVELDLYLLGGTPEYGERLKTAAAGDPRIRFRAPVAYRDLVGVLNRYDIGISVFPPTTFNLAWCLPNKFFDYIQARLGVIVGPSPAMVDLVRERGIGVVTADFTVDALVRSLDGLTAVEVALWKAASAEAARNLSAEEQSAGWESLVDLIAARP